MKDKIISMGVTLAEEKGSYQVVTSQMIAEKLGITSQAVRYHFRRDELHNAIIARAFHTNNKSVVQQAQLAKHPLLKVLSTSKGGV